MFSKRLKEHDTLEETVTDFIRLFTDRKHLPDKRVSFGGIPVSYDIKTNVNVEDSSHHEYFRLLSEGEPIFIVYQDKSNDNKIYVDWIQNLDWHGPIPPSPNSTCNDPYYRISGGRNLEDFMTHALQETRSIKNRLGVHLNAPFKP